MKKLTVSIIIAGLVALTVGCQGGGDNQALATDPEVILKTCIGCHGHDLKGRSGPALLDLQEKYTAEEVAQIIREGKGRMGPMRNLSEEQANILAEWLVNQ